MENLQEIKKQKFVTFYYRNNIKTSGRTETIILAERNGKIVKIEPKYKKRSKTGAHGDDIYTVEYLASQKVVAVVHVNISNSGRHYCRLVIEKELSPLEKARVLKYILENVHDCENIVESWDEVHFDKDFWESLSKI